MKEKKQLLIPYRKSHPVWWCYEGHDEERENIPFKETFKIIYFSRGCSSAKMHLRRVKDVKKYDEGLTSKVHDYEVFLIDSIAVINSAVNGIVSGTWVFVKRGQNYGIKLIE